MKQILEHVLINRVSLNISRSDVSTILEVSGNDNQEFMIEFVDKASRRGDSPLLINFKKMMALYTDRKSLTFTQGTDGVYITDMNSDGTSNVMFLKGIGLTYSQKEIERNA